MISEFTYIFNKLSVKYPKKEAEAISFIIFQDLLKISKTDIFINKTKQLSKNQLSMAEHALNKLMNDMPVQYVTGICDFYGLKLKINRSVLIPRPETEELVDRLIKDNNLNSPYILDVGCGSGCIAISLKKYIPNSLVYAIDKYKRALKLSLENAIKNKTEIIFIQSDVLKNQNNIIPDNFYDYIISNPPYVTCSEKALMKDNVLKYEPGTALFVPDKDPLIFYRKIVDNTYSKLKTNGKYYLEINERFGNEIKMLLSEKGLKDIVICTDILSKERFAIATKK